MSESMVDAVALVFDPTYKSKLKNDNITKLIEIIN